MKRIRIFAAAALVVATGSARLHAQSPAPATTDTVATGLLGSTSGPFLALSVANLDRMVAWYRDTLGFRVFNTGTAPNGTIRFALLQQGNALVELLQLPDARSRGAAAPGTTAAHHVHGFFKSGFVVADIDAVYRRVRAMRLPLAYELGQPPGGPYRSFGLRDPEGNLLQFFGR